jgi:V/A-type H+-transporting ATPase subunit D
MSKRGISGIRPTRIELLKLKKQEIIASKGHDLLQEKLDAMVIEFFRYADAYGDLRGDLDRQVVGALLAMKEAGTVIGNQKLEELAVSAPGMEDIPMGFRVIMGVRVPMIGEPRAAREGIQRSYSYLGTSARTDEASRAFTGVAVAVLKLAELEGTVRRLAAEIKSTRRRVNALEHVLLPRLRETRRYIEMHLEEREREDLFRRKRIKQVIKEHASTGER